MTTREAGIKNVADDLVIEALQTLWPATAILAWLWTVAVMLTAQRYTVYAWIALAFVCGALLVSHQLARRRLRAAVVVYVIGLAGAVSVAAGAFGTDALLYLYSLVVLVVALLMGAQAAWYAALVCTGLILGIGTRLLGLAWPAVIPQVVVLWLTAFTAWLASRGLLTALAWALSMTREAQRNAQEAQDSRAQAQLALKNLDEAYVRLERTTEALLFAREAAEKAYRFKADFVANVSHELRTPLNLIVGFSEMIALAPESYGGVELPRQYRGDVMAVYRSAKHLSELINDVLDLSQIEAGRMPIHREPADLEQVVKEAADIVRGWVEARQLRLTIDIPRELPQLRLDRTRIRQVLLNLLSNATRFTDAGWVRVRALLDGREVTVEVQDSGPGIPRESLARAFETFGQMDPDRAREGSGLGLAISRKFVELHGGRMWIQSEMGKGTTVGFALPLPDGDREFTAPTLVRLPLRRAREDHPPVVVLHADPRAVSVLQRYVEECRFIQAGDAPSAFRAMHEAGASVLIHDGLAGGDWRDGCGELDQPKTLPAYATVVDCPLPSMQRLGKSLGAVDYLSKPVTRDQLLGVLSRLPAPPKSVLIVDDDPDVVRMLGRILKAELPGCQVFEVFDGREALQIARSRRPDTVLLDLLMPGVSGYDLLREIGSAPDLAGMSVVVISARSLEQESAPLAGEVRIHRPAGFTMTETVQLLAAMLPVVARPSPGLSTRAPERPGIPPGRPAS